MNKKELENSEFLEGYHQLLLKKKWLGDIYRKFWLYPHINKYLKGNAIDIGCGNGNFLAYRPNTIGVDVNKFNVDYCMRQGFKAILVGDDLPFEANSFDSANMDNVLEHIEDPSKILEETKRVLRTGGTLAVGVPARRGFEWDQDHKVFYSEEKLKKTIECFGFKQIHTFHMPLKSTFLENRMKFYIYYSVFIKD